MTNNGSKGGRFPSLPALSCSYQLIMLAITKTGTKMAMRMSFTMVASLPVSSKIENPASKNWISDHCHCRQRCDI